MNEHNSSFAKRAGLVTEKLRVGPDAMDQGVRNAFWNVMFRSFEFSEDMDTRTHFICRRLWIDFFEEALDEMPQWNVRRYWFQLRKRFYSLEWHGVLDFFEYVISLLDGDFQEKVEAQVRYVLSDYGLPYVLIEHQFCPLIRDEQVDSIAGAMDCAVENVANHVRGAIEAVSKRPETDYRGCIRESIHAVEAACRYVANKQSATLGDALKIVKRNSAIPDTLATGIEKIYAFTNDKVRHAEKLNDAYEPDRADALFMLVTCSAISTYLLNKYAGKHKEAEEKSE